MQKNTSFCYYNALRINASCSEAFGRMGLHISIGAFTAGPWTAGLNKITDVKPGQQGWQGFSNPSLTHSSYHSSTHCSFPLTPISGGSGVFCWAIEDPQVLCKGTHGDSVILHILSTIYEYQSITI